MFIRAVTVFLVLPGIAACLVPVVIARLDPWATGGYRLGLPLAIVGTLVILWCVRDFYVAGKGTLAPWHPPRELVVIGLYRYARNPMYLGVLMLVFGWAGMYGSPLGILYGSILWIGFHLRIILHEEPWLQSQFPAEWENYRRRVNSWLHSRTES